MPDRHQTWGITLHFPLMQGPISLDAGHLDNILDDFIEERQKDRRLVSMKSPELDFTGPGSGQSVERSLPPGEEEAVARDGRGGDGNGDDDEFDEQEEEQEGTSAEEDHDPEEERNDDEGPEQYMREYLTAKEKPQWDCESILSTLSTLDNHPTMLHEPRRGGPRGRGRQSPADDSEASVEPEAPRRILLSNKTGMPVGVFASRSTGSADGDEEGGREMWW